MLAASFSGAAGLIYQILWARQFSLVIGASQLSVVAVLAAFMGGLALGAAVIGRFMPAIRRPLWWYIGMELATAAAAALVPWLLPMVDCAQRALLNAETGATGSLAFSFSATFIVLLPPTAFMGATLPLLIRGLVELPDEVTPRSAALYAANTMGAVVGVLLAAFVLLPDWGMSGALATALAGNLLAAALALPVARSAAMVSQRHEPAIGRSDQVRTWILPIIGLSGAASFVLEVLWTRMLTQLLGATIYAFGTVLALFLLGIALGAVVVAMLRPSVGASAGAFVASQLGVAISALVAFVCLDPLLSWMTAPAVKLEFGPRMAVATALLFFPTLLIGTTVPLAIRLAARSAAGAGRASARVLAWNTVGAICGAVFAGFWAIPVLEYHGTAMLLSAASCGLALAAAFATGRYRTVSGAVVTGVLLALVLFPPSPPWHLLRFVPITGRIMPGLLRHVAVGRSSTVAVAELPDGDWRLSTDGLPEAVVQPVGGRPGRFAVARWLSLLPLAARPDAREMLVVGFGSGMTIEEVPPVVEQIHVAELESEVLRANEKLADRRRRDPLADPRVRVHVNDARHFLALAESRFDIVVSQPSHPWTSGGSHLYTLEFFRQVRERLSDDGVFCQWLGVGLTDEKLLRSLLATLLEVFPYVEVFEPATGGALLLLGSALPLVTPQSAAVSFERFSNTWEIVRVRTWEDLLAQRVLTTEGVRRLARDPVVTDQRNLFQTDGPRAVEEPLSKSALQELLAPNDPVASIIDESNRGYVLRYLLRTKQGGRARRLVAAPLASLAEQRSLQKLGQLLAGERSAATATFFLREVERRPTSENLYAAVLAHKGRIVGGVGAPRELRTSIEEDPTAGALVAGWQLAGDGDWQRVGALDELLSSLSPYHMLYEEAVRLRVDWRLRTRLPGDIREALQILQPLLGPGAKLSDLLREARLYRVGAEYEILLRKLALIVDTMSLQSGNAAVAKMSPGVVEFLSDSMAEMPEPIQTHWRYLALEDYLDRGDWRSERVS